MFLYCLGFAVLSLSGCLFTECLFSDQGNNHLEVHFILPEIFFTKSSKQFLFFSQVHVRSTPLFSWLFPCLFWSHTHPQGDQQLQVLLAFRVVSEVASHVPIIVKQRGSPLFPLSARMENNQHTHQLKEIFNKENGESKKQQWLVFKGQLLSESPIMQSALERIEVWTHKINT